MTSNNLKGNMASSLFWAYCERVATQGIMFVVSIVLARIIAPNQYGIIAIVTVLISLVDIFVTGGFGSSLVQKENADQLDFNSAFVFSLVFGGLIYFVLFLTSPFLARFYKMDELNLVIKVMGIRIPFAAINTVQHADVQRRMEFKKFFFSTLFGTLVSAFVGIGMAIYGMEVWALVGQYLSNCIIDTIVLLKLGTWKPKFEFSFERIKNIFSYGWKVLLQRLTTTIFNNIQNLVIGRKFSSDELAFYDNGGKIPQVILANIYDTLGRVLFPALASVQNEKEEKKKIISYSIRIGTFILCPIAIGMIAIAKPLICLLLTEKWLACVPFMQVFCVRFLFRPFSTVMQQVVLADGKSGVILMIEIVQDAALVITLGISAFILEDIMLIAWGYMIAVFIGLVIYSILGNKYYDYSLLEQIRDTLPSYMCAFIMGVFLFFMSNICQSYFWTVVIFILAGIFFYIILSLIFNKKIIDCLVKIITSKIKYKKG